MTEKTEDSVSNTVKNPRAAKNPLLDKGGKQKNDTVYILITQCLQNGFFFADDSRLCLDQDIVARMLLHSTITSDDTASTGEASKQTTPRDFISVEKNRRSIASKYVDNLHDGPMYQFLSTLMDKRAPDMDTLHVLHVRDWHRPSRDYDVERELYGPHCEAGTWECEALDGYKEYLSPWVKTKNDADYSVGQQKRLRQEFTATLPDPFNPVNFTEILGGTPHPGSPNVIHYPVLSDSVFDFRRSDTIIDEVYDSDKVDPDAVKPADKTVVDLADKYGLQKPPKPTNPIHRSPSYLEILINSILNIEQQQAKTTEEELHVNIVVIGVYTDIKIRTLLTGLRSRYRIDNLIISDVLTAAPSMERHLEALDFVNKVLQVEVNHSLNDLINVLAPGSQRNISKDIIEDHVDYRQYKSFYLNKQNLLAYQDTKRIEYLELTRTRSKAIYQQVYETNQRLLRFGYIFLIVTVFFGIMYLISLSVSIVFPNVVIRPEHWLLGSIVTGGLSMVQLFAVFFRNPLNSLQDNLNNLIRLRTSLETHSLILALLRYHFSTPDRLSENYLKDGNFEKESAKLDAIQRQIDMIQKIGFSIHSADKDAELQWFERVNQLNSNKPTEEPPPATPTFNG